MGQGPHGVSNYLRYLISCLIIIFESFEGVKGELFKHCLQCGSPLCTPK